MEFRPNPIVTARHCDDGLMDQHSASATVAILMPDGSTLNAKVPLTGSGTDQTARLTAHHALTAASRVVHDAIDQWTRELSPPDLRPSYLGNATVDPSVGHGSDGYINSGPIPAAGQWVPQGQTAVLPRRVPAS